MSRGPKWAALSALAAIGTGWLVSVWPIIGTAAICLTILLILTAIEGVRSLVWLAIFLCFTVVPDVVPIGVHLGAAELKWWEIALPVAVLCNLPWPRRSTGPILVLATWIAAWAYLGQVNDVTTIGAIKDLRPVVEGLFGLTLGATIVARGQQRTALTAIQVSLWVSALVTLVASSAGMPLANAEIQSANLNTQATSEAERFLSVATFLAVAVLCASVAALVVGRATWRQVGWYVVPASILVVLAFSRNHIVALAVAALAAIIIHGPSRSVGRAVTAGAISLAGIVALATFIQWQSPAVPALEPASRVVSGYETRVLGGLSTEARSRDSSAQYRVQESERLWLAIRSNPWVGHGLGFAYQPPTGQRGSFFRETAPYYAHNFYLWLLAKTGIVGALIWLWVYARPVLDAIARRRREAFWVAVPLAGLLASSFFAPLPIGMPNSVLVGLLAGAMLATPPPNPGPEVNGETSAARWARSSA